LSAGLGYSSTESVVVSGSVSQENLFGTGRKLFLEASVGSVTRHFKLSFVEPYLMDMDLSLGLNIFNYQRAMDTYDWKKRGGGFNLTRPLTDYIKLGFAYRYDVTRVYNISSDASSYVKDQFGTKTTSSTTYSISKNTIDNIQDPSKGINSQFAVEIAGGPFGGDNNFYRLGGFYGRYFPWKYLSSTFFLRATAGTIKNYGGGSLPIYEKYFVGGIDSVRGFKYGEAGPTDSTGEPIGSESQLFFNAEWIFPIWKPAGLKGVMFFDYGAGFDGGKGWFFDGLRPAAGFGIRWNSPFGPIRIEFGVNLSPKEGERRTVFDFALGTQY
jgi:outer membrane protein insertion porin family